MIKLNILRKSLKYEKKLDEGIEILNDILNAIKGYSEKEDLLESYHYLRKDIYNINLARLELENSLFRNKLSEDDDYEKLCYENKYNLSSLKSEMEISITEALSAINLLIKNYRSLYLNCDKKIKKELIEDYNNCLKYLNKAKGLLLDRDSVNKYISDKEEKLQEEIEFNFRNEYNIKANTSINVLICKLDKCSDGILKDLLEIVTLIGGRKVESVFIILKKLKKRSEFIDIIINILRNNNFIENKEDIINNLNYIENENNKIKTNIDLISYNSKIVLMDIQLNKPIDADDFKESTDKVKLNFKKIKKNIFKINFKLKENYHKEISESIVLEDTREDIFNIDFYIRYYYYDTEDIKEEWDNYEEILREIEKCTSFEQEGYSFKYTKSGMILATKTKENIKIKFIDDCKNIEINGKVKYINLNKRFEIDKLEKHTRITTIINELNDYTMCVFYIDNLKSDEFVKELEKLKNLQNED